MDTIQIGELLKEHFFKQKNIKSLKCDDIYQKAIKFCDKLENTLTKEQNHNLYWFREYILQYHNDFIDEYTEFLINNIKQIYGIN